MANFYLFGQVGVNNPFTNYFQLGVHNLAEPYNGNAGPNSSYTSYDSGILQHRTPQDAYQYNTCQGTRLGFQRKANSSDKPYFLMIISYATNPAAYIPGTPYQNNPDWAELDYGQEAYLNLITDQDFYIGFTVDAPYSSNGYVTAPNDIWYVKFNVAKGIILNAPTICPGQTANLVASGCGLQLAQNSWDPSYPPLLTYWSNGSISTSQISISPTTTTNYTLQTKCWVNSHIPNLGVMPTVYLLTTTYQTTVTVQVPVTPNIMGANTRCPNNNTYTIGNYQPSQAYNITVSHGTANAINANGQFTVTWAANFPNPGVATITVNTTTGLGCAATTTFEVASCCTGTAIDGYQPIVFTNATASQMLQSTNFNGVVNQIVLNGTIVIDQNLSIISCQNIKMAPNAEIIINPGKTLTINGSRLAADECPYVWKGIVLPDPNANIVVTNNAKIEDARNAIWAKNHADVNVTGSKFINNNVSLRFTDLEPKEVIGPTPPPANTSVVFGNEFKTDGNFKAPFASSYKGFTGVYTDNIYLLNIGQTAQGQNHFHTIGSALYAINSYVKFVNNKAENTTNSAIGFQNHLVYQNGGLVYRMYSRIYAKDNTFKGTMPNAIYGFGWLEAEYNTFNNRSGNSPTIWVRETNTASYVKNNTFNPLNNTTPVNMTVPAIKLERAAAPFKGMQLHVQNNVIQRYRSGIELTNTQANVTNVIPYLSNRKVRVTDNEINNADNGNTYSKVYGIRLQHANGAKVADNTTKRLGNWTTSEARTQTERGIALSQTQNAQVVNNEIDSYGNGIWGAGNLKGTYFGCNILEQDFYGFYFLPPSSTGNTVISHQGNPSRTTQNRWIDPLQSVGGFDRVAGQVNATPKPEWYYNTTPNLYDSQISLVDQSNIIGQGINQVPQNNCNTFVWWTEGSYFKNYREDELGAIVQNEQQYQTLQEEFAQYGAEYLYDLLTMVPEVMDSLTPAEDEIYQNWMDSISATNIAAFYDVMEALDNGDVTAAILQNAQIVPTNSIEANRKLVNYFYLTKYVQGIALGYEDEQALEPIALQTPYVGGDAVFGARVMLGIDPDEEGIAYKGELDNGQQIAEKYRVYPNPASNVLNIEMTEKPFTANTEVLLLDITGRVVMRYTNETSAMDIRLPIQNVQNGIYLLQVMQADEILLTERIVVNR